LLNRLADHNSCDFSRLTNEELDQFADLYQKVLATPTESKLSVTPDNESKTKHGLPRRIEMLSILSRYEASLIAGRNKALNLLYGVKAARAAAEDDARTIWASPADGRLLKPQ
jgi:hypothetical protein